MPPIYPRYRIVCYSGGHSSAITAIEVARRYGTGHLVLLNHDINSRVEDADIKRFKADVAAYLGCEITYANMQGWDEKDQLDVVVDAGAFKVGNGTALCTSRLKTRPFEEFLSQSFPRKNCVIYYGFDASESRRIQRRTAHLLVKGYLTDYPLALWKTRTIQSTKEIGIEPPNTYSVFKHANCVGCLKAGKQHWYVVYCTRPDIWEKAKWAEVSIGYTILRAESLADLEPLFARMKQGGIPATEHIPSGQFWANVRHAGLDCVEQDDGKPCECVI